MSLHRAGMAPTSPTRHPRAHDAWSSVSLSPPPPPRGQRGEGTCRGCRLGASGRRCPSRPCMPAEGEPSLPVRATHHPVGGLDGVGHRLTAEGLSRGARRVRALATQRLSTLPRVDSSPIVGCVTPHGFAMSGQVRVSTAQALPEGAEGDGDARTRHCANRRLTEYVSSQKPSNKGECVARTRTPSGCFRPVPSGLNARRCAHE